MSLYDVKLKRPQQLYSVRPRYIIINMHKMGPVNA